MKLDFEKSNMIRDQYRIMSGLSPIGTIQRNGDGVFRASLYHSHMWQEGENLLQIGQFVQELNDAQHKKARVHIDVDTKAGS